MFLWGKQIADALTRHFDMVAEQQRKDMAGSKALGPMMKRTGQADRAGHLLNRRPPEVLPEECALHKK